MSVSIKVIDLLNEIKSELNSIYPKEEIHAITALLMQHVLVYTKTEVYTHEQDIISSDDYRHVRQALKLLKQQIPIEYIIGITEFYGIPIKVSPEVLIPRPETEELVEAVLNTPIPAHPKILDIGTGSGCIAVALAKNLQNAEIHAIDVFPGALEIAKKNAKDNGVEVYFHQRNILNGSITDDETYDLIVSNPPYVTMSEKKFIQKKVLEHEPAIALFVPDDQPLLFYEAIASFSMNHLKKKGWLLLEINERFGAEIIRLFNEKGFEKPEVMKDINGKDRIVKIKWMG